MPRDTAYWIEHARMALEMAKTAWTFAARRSPPPSVREEREREDEIRALETRARSAARLQVRCERVGCWFPQDGPP
jgi:hypothetical protein